MKNLLLSLLLTFLCTISYADNAPTSLEGQIFEFAIASGSGFPLFSSGDGIIAFGPAGLANTAAFYTKSGNETDSDYGSYSYNKTSANTGTIYVYLSTGTSTILLNVNADQSGTWSLSNVYGSQSGTFQLVLTKTPSELTDLQTAARTEGINQVLSAPADHDLYTLDSVKSLSMGRPVLTKDDNGQLVLVLNLKRTDNVDSWTTADIQSVVKNGNQIEVRFNPPSGTELFRVEGTAP